VPRPVVDEAQRADPVPTGARHGVAGVEADAGLADHRGVVREPLVLGRVLDDERFRTSDRDVAEGVLATAVGQEHRPGLGLVHLHGVRDQRHRRRGDPEQLLRHAGDPVEPLLGAATEHVECRQVEQPLALGEHLVRCRVEQCLAGHVLPLASCGRGPAVHDLHRHGRCGG
jgi:hypothetical protein